MLIGSAFVFVYLATGLTLALVIGSVLDSRVKLPAKYEREAVKLEQQMAERGIDREMMLLALVMIWPMLLGIGRK